MLNVKMDYKKGILFIRLDGKLNEKTYKYFENEIIPLLLLQGISKVVINLDKLLYLDKKGIESLSNLETIINSNNGTMSLCSLTSKEVKKALHNNMINTFYEFSNELTAIGEMK